MSQSLPRRCLIILFPLSANVARCRFVFSSFHYLHLARKTDSARIRGTTYRLRCIMFISGRGLGHKGAQFENTIASPAPWGGKRVRQTADAVGVAPTEFVANNREKPACGDAGTLPSLAGRFYPGRPGPSSLADRPSNSPMRTRCDPSSRFAQSRQARSRSGRQNLIPKALVRCCCIRPAEFLWTHIGYYTRIPARLLLMVSDGTARYSNVLRHDL